MSPLRGPGAASVARYVYVEKGSQLQAQGPGLEPRSLAPGPQAHALRPGPSPSAQAVEPNPWAWLARGHRTLGPGPRAPGPRAHATRNNSLHQKDICKLPINHPSGRYVNTLICVAR